MLHRREPFQSSYHGGPEGDTGQVQRADSARPARRDITITALRRHARLWETNGSSKGHEACLVRTGFTDEYGQDEIRLLRGESELTEEVTEAIREAGVRSIRK